ncbi:hypothetical protein J8273_7987 [Carpediemonas membranifera]|uniref:Uncharacterized protein n=1 Tax=Carpediemonas membranifera TaxID=201153 RepID=A0A8J6DZE7_9EUKA|nr:hypothetical protein J8273_7987 [Carpediemonas membranifera]|eukprot:KAG9390623.1 hypothetical protein J8273_7987 [Carpediemonas membranifera]
MTALRSVRPHQTRREMIKCSLLRKFLLPDDKILTALLRADIGWKTLRKLFRSPHLILHLRETAEAQLELITTSAELKKVMGDHAYDSLVQKVRREVSSDHEHDVAVLSLLRERIMRRTTPSLSCRTRSTWKYPEWHIAPPAPPSCRGTQRCDP